jgi:hypothetical protein
MAVFLASPALAPELRLLTVTGKPASESFTWRKNVAAPAPPHLRVSRALEVMGDATQPNSLSWWISPLRSWWQSRSNNSRRSFYIKIPIDNGEFGTRAPTSV